MDRELVTASYHQVHLAPMGSSPVFAGEDPMALALVDESQGALIIVTGIADGPVRMTIRDQPAEPSAEETADGWDESAEVAIRIDEPLFISSPTWTPVREPAIDVVEPGVYRVRVDSRGRGTDYDGSTSTPSEEFRITFWPDREVGPPHLGLN